MKHLFTHLLLALLLALLAACAASGQGQDQTAVPGPALLMFYTDN